LNEREEGQRERKKEMETGERRGGEREEQRGGESVAE